MNSYGRSPRVTDQLTEREEREGTEEEAIIQIAVPMPRLPLHMPLAPTTVVGVDAEATATALDMVKSNIKQKKNLFAARDCDIKDVSVRMPRNQNQEKMQKS